MITCKGYDIVGGTITTGYHNGKTYTGKVIAQRKIAGKGNLLTVETADGVKSIYWEKTVDCVFRPIVPTFRNSDDGYDAAKDRRLERYGMR
jgi:hypothetical protein